MKKANNFTDEILKSNQQKVISLCLKVNEEMNRILKREEQSTEDLRNRLIEYRRESKSIITGAGNSLSHKLNSKIDTEFSTLKKNLFNIIDGKDFDAVIRRYATDTLPPNIFNTTTNSGKKRKAEHEVYKLMNSLSEDLSRIVENEIHTMEQKLKTKKKQLEGINLHFNIGYNVHTQVGIDTDEALDELDINLDDIGNFAMSTIGLAGLGLIFGPIGAIAGGVLGAIGHAWFHNDGKGDAKNIIAQNIEESKKKVKNSIDKDLQKLKNQLNNKQRQIENVLNQELENLAAINDLTDRLQQKMDITMQKYKN